MHKLRCHHKPMQQATGCCWRQCSSGRVERGHKACISSSKRGVAVERTGHSCRQPSTVTNRHNHVFQASMHNGSTANSSNSSSKMADNADSNGARCPVLILPGFLSNNTTSEQSQYRELANNLLALGHPAAEILPATTWDWLPTLSGGSFKWYIQRMAAAVQQLADKYNSQVCLVGISAGGWLARLALGSVPYHGDVWALAPKVHTLVTCGTPHQSKEAYPFGRAEEAWICNLPEEVSSSIQTSLQYANHFYPDADSLKPTNIVCVAGNATKGEDFNVSQVGLQIITGRLPIATANDQWFVQSSYVANCGVANVEGDGVCPVQTALIPGAAAVVLPGVWHNQEPGKLWYGSMEVVQQWDKYLP